MTRVLVPLAEGFEEVEALTVVDVLRRAEVEVVTAGVGRRQIAGKHGVRVIADQVLAEVADQAFDMVVLPGGVPGVPNLAADETVTRVVMAHAEREAWVTAICAAPFVLHAHGLIPRGARITSHPSVADDLKTYDYHEDRVVKDGDILTSRGPGTAMEFALTLAEMLAGSDVRSDLEAAMLTAKS